jgi:hypothetical protein
MFRPTEVIISTVQNKLTEYICIDRKQISYDCYLWVESLDDTKWVMGVVWRSVWWVYCAYCIYSVYCMYCTYCKHCTHYIVYILYILYIVYILHTLYMLHTLHTLYTLHLLYILNTLYILYTLHILYMLYILYILYILYTIYILYILYILYTMYMLYTLYILYILYTLYILQSLQFLIQFTNNKHLFISHSLMCPFPCWPLRYNQCCLWYCIALFYSCISQLYCLRIITLPHYTFHIFLCNFFLSVITVFHS